MALRIWLAFFAMLLSGTCFAADKLPNIVFILSDDLGCYDVGCYGQKKIKTPAIDQLAEKGMKFNRFYSGSPVCAPSRCMLMTGKHPGHAAVRDNREAKPEGQYPLAASETTLAEMLQAKGYTTTAIGKWGLGMFGTEGDPLKQGFNHFFGYNCQRHAHTHYPTYLYRDDKRFDLPGNNGATGDTFTGDLFEQEALKFITDSKDKPFFLFLPFTVPHVALQVPEDSLKEYQGKLGDDPAYDGKKGYRPHPAPRAAYAAMITRMDRTVGRIVDKLKELKLDDNTLVFFASDNGGTHNAGGADCTFFESHGKLRGQKGSVYEGGIRVPGLAYWPGKIAPGQTTDLPFAFWDVLPTLAELTGATAPSGIDGISFLPTLLNRKDQKAHDFLYWEFPGYGGQQAVIQGDWKAVRQQLGKGTIKTELYNLKNDINETTDVAEKHPKELAALEKLMQQEHRPNPNFPLQTIDGKVEGKKK